MSSIKGNHILSNGGAALLGLRIAQLVVAVAVLGLSAYGVYYLSFDGDNMTLFSSLATIIIVVYYLIATLSFPKLYNYWAILGLEILAVIFWVVSFPLLASEIANSLGYYSYSDYYSSYGCTYSYDGYCYYKQKRGLELAKRATTTFYTYRNAMIAAAALGGLEFLLFVATLIIVAIGISRHRKNGGHCVPGMTQTQAPVHEVQETV
ncbi:Integral membrane protein [Rutstroemia sp. NJR-2017a WRK4]|nr:Integral membrane protein [Rutstroemia sp. NJR-2017a WRK4]